jgi:hypothetical protein
MWEAALKQFFMHFPFKCQRQHMLETGVVDEHLPRVAAVRLQNPFLGVDRGVDCF